MRTHADERADSRWRTCRLAGTRAAGSAEAAGGVGGPAGDGGAAARRTSPRAARSPSSADAPAGSPSTPFGLTAATPPARIVRQQVRERGRVARRPPRTDERGVEREHQRRLRAARVGVAAGERRRTRRRRAPRTGAAGRPRRRVETLPPWPLTNTSRPAQRAGRPAQLDQQQPQRLVPDRHRAREALVLARGAVGDGWGDEQGTGRRTGGDRRGDPGVGVERQVRTVLLDGADRHEQRRPAVDLRPDALAERSHEWREPGERALVARPVRLPGRRPHRERQRDRRLRLARVPRGADREWSTSERGIATSVGRGRPGPARRTRARTPGRARPAAAR